MAPELERILVQKYPLIFADIGCTSTATGMAFGIQCDDGWFDLLDVLCAHLSELANWPQGDREETLCATEVKEKFGSLRFHLKQPTDETFALTHFAQGLSKKICEVCGNRGHIRQNDSGWNKTLCISCAKNG